jgi:hypothetical protein
MGSHTQLELEPLAGVEGRRVRHVLLQRTKEHNFLFGPQVNFRGGRANFFTHGLGGVSHGNPLGVNQNVAAWAFGGGVDWKWSRDSRLSLRLAQADYLRTQYAGTAQNTFRYSTGLVFSFGGNK